MGKVLVQNDRFEAGLYREAYIPPQYELDAMRMTRSDESSVKHYQC